MIRVVMMALVRWDDRGEEFGMYDGGTKIRMDAERLTNENLEQNSIPISNPKRGQRFMPMILNYVALTGCSQRHKLHYFDLLDNKTH